MRTLVTLALLLAACGKLGDPIERGGDKAAMKGRVVDPWGRPAVGAWIHLIAGEDSAAREADKDGLYRFSGLGSGTYAFAAILRRGDTVFSILRPGLALSEDADLGTDTLRFTGTLLLQVRGPDNRPAAGMMCSAGEGVWAVLSDSLGICALPDLPVGSVRVTVTRPSDGGEAVVDVIVFTGTVNGGIVALPEETPSGPPAAPALIAPAHAAVDVSPQPALLWRRISGATYHVQVALDSGFTSRILSDSGLVDTMRLAGPLAVNTDHYWRVRARNAAGTGPWSPARSFRTVSQVLPRLAVVAVADARLASAVPGRPDANALGDGNRGGEIAIMAGNYDLNSAFRSLVRFRIPAGYTPQSITSATIRFTTREWVSKSPAAPARIDLHRMLKSWKEGTGVNNRNSAAVDGATAKERFWGSQDGSEDWAGVLCALGTDAEAVPVATASKSFGDMTAWNFDVTALAKSWAADSATNFGVLLATGLPSTSAEVLDYAELHSREASVPDSAKPLLILNGTILSP